MLGIVRLFCDQVKETEKEADSCLQRVLAPKIRAKRAATSSAPDPEEKEEDLGDLRTMWKEGRRLLALIDYAAGPPPGLLSMRYNSTLPPEQVESTIWRDTDDPSASYSEAEEMRGDGEDGFIEVPRRAPTAIWNLAAAPYIPEDVDPTRGGDDHATDMDAFAGDSLDFVHHNSNSESVHFLDMLLERHETGGFDGTLESTISLIQENDAIQRRISDLLAPEFADDSDDEPPSQGLYDPGITALHDDWATVDMSGNDVPNDDSSFKIGTDALNESSLGSMTLDHSASASSSTKRKPRTYPIDETTTIPHAETKALVGTFNAPRPASDTQLDARTLERRKLEKEKFGTLSQVMGLREGKNAQACGALAYLLLAHQTAIRIPLPDIGPLAELSYHPQEDTNNPSGGELSYNAFPFDASFLSDPAAPSDEFIDSNEDYGEPTYRGDQPIGGEGDGVVNFNTELGADVDDYDDTSDIGVSEFVIHDPPAGEGVPQIQMDDNLPFAADLDAIDDFSADASYLGAYIEPAAGPPTLTHSSLDGVPPEAKGLSKALLNYLALKTTVELSHSSEDAPSVLLHHEKSTSTDEHDLVSQYSGDRNSYAISQLLKGCKRRTAARTFLHLLELASISSISLEQEEPYADINITVLTSNSATLDAL